MCMPYAYTHKLYTQYHNYLSKLLNQNYGLNTVIPLYQYLDGFAYWFKTCDWATWRPCIQMCLHVIHTLQYPLTLLVSVNAAAILVTASHKLVTTPHFQLLALSNKVIYFLKTDDTKCGQAEMRMYIQLIINHDPGVANI